MSFSRSILAAAFVLAIGVISCNILKSSDSEEDIRAFLSGFESSLKLTDEDILKQFETQQSREAILSAIHVLQDKESDYIKCTLTFAQAKIISDDQGLRVSIPAMFSSKNLDDDNSNKQTTFTIWLKEKEHGYMIIRLEGEEFYKAFAELRNMLKWDVERQTELNKRRPIYARAQALQQQYDSVIWYATYEGKNYFYVVNGRWVNYFENDNTIRKNLNTGYTMGLVDEDGAVIVPVEYELIGTIGFDKPGVVEVKKNGMAGYYDIAERKQLINAAYDMIIPVNTLQANAFVRADSVYGWFDKAYEYHAGFTSETEKAWINGFGFLPKELSLKSDQQSLCEIPGETYAGYGIVMPLSCYVKTGLFNEIVAGISTTAIPMRGWTDYVETKGTVFQQVTEGISALMTTITQRYLDGREEFYTSNRLVFMSPSHDTLAVSNLSTESVIHLKRVGESLIEIKAKPLLGFDSEMDDTFEEYDIPEYTYFSLENGVIEKKSRRWFGFTQFVKIDSNYLMGEFHHYDLETDAEEQRTFLSLSTLQVMRNEILADYGYRFKDSVDIARFKNSAQNIDSIDEFRDQLTEVDRHNLEFLDKVIALLNPAKPI